MCKSLLALAKELGFVSIPGVASVCEEADYDEVSMLHVGLSCLKYLHKTVKDPSIMNRYRHASSFDWMGNTPNANRPEKAFAMFDAA